MNAGVMQCRVDARREKLFGQTALNGIDYLEVDDDQLGLTLHLFAPPPPNLGVANLRIEGGRRVTGIRTVAIAPIAGSTAVHVALDKYGDFSTYTLRLVDAVAEAVGRAQDRLVLVGQVPVLAGLGGPGERADRGDCVDDVLGVRPAEGRDGVEESLVCRGDVVADQRRRLVGRCTLQGIHVATVEPWWRNR